MKTKGFIKGTEVTLEVLNLTHKQEREILNEQKMEYAEKFYRINGKKDVRIFRNDGGVLRISVI